MLARCGLHPIQTGENGSMMERRQIVELWQKGPEQNGAGVLVTLVRVEGSSYRQRGARLLTSATGGGYAGTVSGGCLETDVVRKASWMVRAGAIVERYAMSFDDTAEIPFGLGCGGTVDLLFESTATAEGEALLAAMAASLEGRESTVISFLPGDGRGLRRLVLAADGMVRFASAGLSEEKIECARRLEPGAEYEGRFVEALRSPQRLFVLGAGDDAKPVVRFSSLLGWTAIVAEGRAQLARAERFPDASRVLTVETADALAIQPEDAVVLMTHSYEQDRRLLISLLRLKPRYLGILGSRHRSSLLISEAAAELGRTLESCCEGVFAPVGMDLGGDGPEAIALAIISEVQALCHERLAGSRRLTPEEIMAQIEKGGSSRYLQAQCALDAV
jgi:xanthine dehydrogenase accessory factor